MSKRTTYFCDLCEEEIKNKLHLITLKPGSQDVLLDCSLVLTPKGDRITTNEGICIKANINFYIGAPRGKGEFHFHKSCLRSEIHDRYKAHIK